MCCIRSGRARARIASRESGAWKSRDRSTRPASASTPSRARVFVCRPQNQGEELPCAKTILSSLARKAYRRPITESDLEAPLAFYSAARGLSDFDTAIRDALPTILASPKFLYRAERSPSGLAPGSVHAIGDVELASRLSFFLIGRAPDEELLAVAERGTLTTPSVLDAQVRRLLADPRAESLVSNFAFQWLKMRALEEIDPDPIIFPNFDDSLRAAFRREMELFVGSVLREDRSVLDLLTANHTFVNERLALHYGIPNVRGDRFRRITLTRSEPLGPARKGRGAADDVLRQPHGAGAAGRLDPGEHPGNAAGGAAARRRSVPGKQGRREGAVGARDHGAASRQAVLQRLPRRDGSAGLRARELRCHRRVASRGPVRWHGDRCLRQPHRRHGSQQPRRPSRGPDQASRSVRADADRAADDLRARPHGGVLRHADGAPDRARVGARQVSLLVDRDGHRPERPVPDADGARAGASGNIHRVGSVRPKSEARRPGARHVHHKEASLASHVPSRRRCGRRIAPARRHGPGVDRAGSDGGGAEAAHGIHVSAARRDHGALDAGRGGRRTSSCRRSSSRSHPSRNS